MIRKTTVSIQDEAWLINGKPTYEGRTFRESSGLTPYLIYSTNKEK